MIRLLILSLILTLFACRSDKTEYLGDIEIIFHENGGSSSYLGEDNFQNEEARKLNSEGIKLAKSKKFEKAKMKFLEGLEVEPENPTLLNNLGNTEHKLKNFRKAITYFEKSFKISDSTYLNASLNLGLLYWKDYEFEKSAQILEYTLSKSKNQYEKAFANLQLAKTYLDQNNCEKSELHFNNAKEELKNIAGFRKTLQDLKSEVDNCVQHRL